MNMHRSTKVRFLFLMPAVCWVLIFTLFPLCYSLYISFHKVENRLNVTREKVPVLDQEGNPELSKSGKPRTRTNVIREKISIWTNVGFTNYKRLWGDPHVASAVKVTTIFVLTAVPIQLILGLLLAMLFNRRLWARSMLRTIMILPIFATPLAVGYLFFTIFYEVGGPL